MRVEITTFAQLIGGGDGAIKRVEIPLIQRDYAQGRTDPATSQIRSAFLEVLHAALSANEPQEIGLDFVYGDVETDSGTLRPLDGQQRLTTLFLLHWYIAYRAESISHRKLGLSSPTQRVQVHGCSARDLSDSPRRSTANPLRTGSETSRGINTSGATIRRFSRCSR